MRHPLWRGCGDVNATALGPKQASESGVAQQLDAAVVYLAPLLATATSEGLFWLVGRQQALGAANVSSLEGQTRDLRRGEARGCHCPRFAAAPRRLARTLARHAARRVPLCSLVCRTPCGSRRPDPWRCRARGAEAWHQPRCEDGQTRQSINFGQSLEILGQKAEVQIFQTWNFLAPLGRNKTSHDGSQEISSSKRTSNLVVGAHLVSAAPVHGVGGVDGRGRGGRGECGGRGGRRPQRAAYPDYRDPWHSLGVRTLGGRDLKVKWRRQFPVAFIGALHLPRTGSTSATICWSVVRRSYRYCVT